MIYAPDAEMALIGGTLAYPEQHASALDRLRPEHFSDPRHQLVWESILRQSARGCFSLQTVLADFAGDENFQKTGGARWLADLYDKGNGWAVDAHVELVLDRAARREIARLAGEIGKAATATAEGSAESILADLERGAAEIAREGVSREAWKPLAFVAQEALAAARERRGMPGLPIGLIDVDRITGGLRKGQVTLLAGRPAMGKSSAALAVAKSVAAQGRGVAFFSLEMTEQELGLRMACDLAFDHGAIMYSGEDDNPSYFKAEWGALTDHQWSRLDEARGRMTSWPLLFDTRPALTASQIHSAARRVTRNWRKAGVEPGCIIVDHIGLIRPEIGRQGSKTAETADVSGAIREMAKSLGIPVVALCQLSRDVERRDGKDRRPIMADLRWAGELEQDAHVIMFLYRPEYYLRQPEPTGDADKDFEAEARFEKQRQLVRNKLHWIVAKNRQGPTGEAETFCRIECSAIRDLGRAA